MLAAFRHAPPGSGETPFHPMPSRTFTFLFLSLVGLTLSLVVRLPAPF
jgi:hypothetical protein